jgi:hypothetical protein
MNDDTHKYRVPDDCPAGKINHSATEIQNMIYDCNICPHEQPCMVLIEGDAPDPDPPCKRCGGMGRLATGPIPPHGIREVPIVPTIPCPDCTIDVKGGKR